MRDVLAAGCSLFLVIPDCRLHFLSVLVCSSELIEENLWAIMTHYDSLMSLLMFYVSTILHRQPEIKGFFFFFIKFAHQDLSPGGGISYEGSTFKNFIKSSLN